jgi:hypothetical protein
MTLLQNAVGPEDITHMQSIALETLHRKNAPVPANDNLNAPLTGKTKN